MNLNLNDRKWEESFFNNILSVHSTSSGIDKNKLVAGIGDIPYITRTDKSNGIDNFICAQDVKYNIDYSNVITIGLDTQTVFYQPSTMCFLGVEFFSYINYKNNTICDRRFKIEESID